jgi:hypothetical protein
MKIRVNITLKTDKISKIISIIPYRTSCVCDITYNQVPIIHVSYIYIYIYIYIYTVEPLITDTLINEHLQ